MNQPANMDPAATLVGADDLQPFVDRLSTGRLHFQLTDTNDFPQPDVGPPPPLPPNVFTAVGFLERWQSNDPLRQPAPGAPISLVGDGVGITATTRGGPSLPNPAGITCTIALTMSDPASLSVAVSDTTADPPFQAHRDNVIWFEVANGPITGLTGAPVSGLGEWIRLTDGNGPYILTIAMWSRQWFIPTRTNVLGGKFLPPVPGGG